MSTTAKRYGIVVGVDGSAAANAGVFWAAREAAMRHLPVTLVHMAKIAGDAVPRTRKLTTSCQLKCSPPVPTPTEMSDKAEMVVVASNGRGGMSGMLLGSVSNAVGHSITTPLIVARAN